MCPMLAKQVQAAPPYRHHGVPYSFLSNDPSDPGSHNVRSPRFVVTPMPPASLSVIPWPWGLGLPGLRRIRFSRRFHGNPWLAGSVWSMAYNPAQARCGFRNLGSPQALRPCLQGHCRRAASRADPWVSADPWLHGGAMATWPILAEFQPKFRQRWSSLANNSSTPAKISRIRSKFGRSRPKSVLIDQSKPKSAKAGRDRPKLANMLLNKTKKWPKSGRNRKAGRVGSKSGQTRAQFGRVGPKFAKFGRSCSKLVHIWPKSVLFDAD